MAALRVFYYYIKEKETRPFAKVFRMNVGSIRAKYYAYLSFTLILAVKLDIINKQGLNEKKMKSQHCKKINSYYILV